MFGKRKKRELFDCPIIFIRLYSEINGLKLQGTLAT